MCVCPDDDVDRFCEMSEIQRETHKIVSALRRDLRVCVREGAMKSYKNEKQDQVRYAAYGAACAAL